MLLPHLRDRPLTLKRHYNGPRSPFEWIKDAPPELPDSIRTTAQPAKSRGGAPVRYVLADSVDARLDPTSFTPSVAPKRVVRIGDLFAPLFGRLNASAFARPPPEVAAGGDACDKGRDDVRGWATARKVLYFPYISVPENAWFTRVLLYWDEVGSIVPSPYEADRSRLTPYMAELVEAELVLPIVPARYDEYLSRALRPFLEFVDSDPEIAARSGGPLGTVSAPRGRAPVGSVVQIHRDKFAVHTEGFSIHGGKLGHSLTEELLQRGLARQGDGDWFEVEARTGSAYMAFLAAGLGGLPEVDMDPITDRVSNLASFAGTESPDDPIAVANALAMRVVEGVLPGPAEGVAVGELADFKERHGALLARFRARLESHLLDIAPIPDERLRERKLLVLTEELQAELEEVEARMRERNWPRLVFGTLCSVLGAAIPVGTALATGAIPVAAAGAPGLASAVYSAKQAMGDRRDFEQAPLAYAALARERLATT